MKVWVNARVVSIRWGIKKMNEWSSALSGRSLQQCVCVFAPKTQNNQVDFVGCMTEWRVMSSPCPNLLRFVCLTWPTSPICFSCLSPLSFYSSSSLLFVHFFPLLFSLPFLPILFPFPFLFSPFFVTRLFDSPFLLFFNPSSTIAHRFFTSLNSFQSHSPLLLQLAPTSRQDYNIHTISDILPQARTSFSSDKPFRSFSQARLFWWLIIFFKTDDQAAWSGRLLLAPNNNSNNLLRTALLFIHQHYINPPPVLFAFSLFSHFHPTTLLRSTFDTYTHPLFLCSFSFLSPH